MSKAPRIVAELGRPETPEETSARKAEQTRRHYSHQTLRNLVWSLVATLITVAVLVLVVLRPNPPEPAPIEYKSLAVEAESFLGVPLLAPDLPEGWAANAAEIRGTSSDVLYWYTGFLTPDEESFTALSQAVDANSTWINNTLREATQTGTMTIGDTEWAVYDQRGASDVGNLEFAMVTEQGDSTVVLFGTAADTEFLQFAEAVTDDLETLDLQD
ncbi:DUF4245 domain-containing protein [Humidisolicoccus flavus]|uniref:DUF4245 domain-containing protein n=1 Tax=Humidisolicoccus flavus TaxID=3111414 RepID=UPI003255175A